MAIIAMIRPPVNTQVTNIVPPGYPCRFPFPFFFFHSSFLLSLLSFSVFPPSFSLCLFLVLFVFTSCRFSVCFFYRLAFLGGGFWHSIISSRGYTPPRSLPCEPELLIFPLRALACCLFAVDLVYFFIFILSFFRLRSGHRLFHPFLCHVGTSYAVSLVSVSAGTCL